VTAHTLGALSAGSDKLYLLDKMRIPVRFIVPAVWCVRTAFRCDISDILYSRNNSLRLWRAYLSTVLFEMCVGLLCSRYTSFSGCSTSTVCYVTSLKFLHNSVSHFNAQLNVSPSTVHPGTHTDTSRFLRGREGHKQKCLECMYCSSSSSFRGLIGRLSLGRQHKSNSNKTNTVALVRERTIPTERPPPVGEISANFCG
jgi:hypothetical protein